jgi:hypothetical protein
MALIGSPDEIAPVEDFEFAKRAGKMIARAAGKTRRRYLGREMRLSSLRN